MSIFEKVKVKAQELLGRAEQVYGESHGDAAATAAGEANVILHLTAVGTDTEVTIEEDAVAGPGLLVPKALRDPQLHWRNDEALQRLAYVVENRP